MWLPVVAYKTGAMRKVQTLFFDMNSYFASVWQAEEPSLRGRPVGVVTTLSAGAACIAASLEAKKTGVKVGTRTQEAQQLCPDIVFRPALHDMFVSYHHRIKAAVDTVLPIDKTHSVDEFSCRLMGTQQDLDTALQIGRDLQAAILTQVSPALRSSVGVAPNKLLAKIAAELEKPMGLNWLLPEVLPDRISHLRCDQLPGISKGMLRRLDAAGIVDIPMLYHLPPKQARHIWRSVEGERFVRQLRGETVVPPPIKHSSLGHGQQRQGRFPRITYGAMRRSRISCWRRGILSMARVSSRTSHGAGLRRAGRACQMKSSGVMSAASKTVVRSAFQVSNTDCAVAPVAKTAIAALINKRFIPTDIGVRCVKTTTPFAKTRISIPYTRSGASHGRQ